MIESYLGSVIYQDWILSWFCYLSGLKPILVLWGIVIEFYHGSLFIRIKSYPGSVIYHDRILSLFCYLSWKSYPGSVIYHDSILFWFYYLSWENPILVRLFIRTKAVHGSVIYQDFLSWFYYLSWEFYPGLLFIMIESYLGLLFITIESYPGLLFIMIESYPGFVIYDWKVNTILILLFIRTELAELYTGSAFFNECFDIQVQSLLIFRVSQTSIICRFVCKGPIKLVASETTELTRQISLHLFSWIMIPLQLSTCLF